MVFLVILIVATSVLVAWLLVALGRATLGELRLPRLREGSVQGASPSASPVPAVPASAGGYPAETGRRELDADQNRRRPAQAKSHRPPARREKRRDERVLCDEIDVEQAVRDRLYGRHGRRD